MIYLEELLFDISSDYILTEDDLYEMVRIKPGDSGLRCVMFMTSCKYAKGRHWARIKISNVPGKFEPDDNFVVDISKSPKIIAGKSKLSKTEENDIFDWIILNYDPLIKYWNDKYEKELDFYQELKRL